MSFDLACCISLINNESQFQSWGFDWDIKRGDAGKIVLESEYWDKGFPHTYLFQAINPSNTVLGLRKEFIDFRDRDLISGDLQYKILSTLAMPYEYKLLLYVIVKLPKPLLNKELHRLQSRGDEIYGKLIEYVDLYEGSPLFYEDEWQRCMKLKTKQCKKMLRFNKKPRRT